MLDVAPALNLASYRFAHEADDAKTTSLTQIMDP